MVALSLNYELGVQLHIPATFSFIIQFGRNTPHNSVTIQLVMMFVFKGCTLANLSKKMRAHCEVQLVGKPCMEIRRVNRSLEILMSLVRETCEDYILFKLLFSNNILILQ